MKNRTKTVIEKSQQFISSWTEFAPEATLAGKTLAQFTTDSQAPNDVQAQIVSAKTKYTGYINDRNEAILVLRDQLVNLANAVRCDPDHGLNSAFYRSLGYITKTERKNPTRKALPAEPAVTPPAANVV
jgi:hypothetical protein